MHELLHTYVADTRSLTDQLSLYAGGFLYIYAAVMILAIGAVAALRAIHHCRQAVATRSLSFVKSLLALVLKKV